MSEDNKKSAKPNFGDPVAFMRALHPDLYSDSTTTRQPQLTEDLLGYHLESLTSRNQETDFANFARRIAQKEICPNLRPQTGPTGGGDSKADSETIPVAPEISELWVGEPKGGSERWAFAISAKKKWQDKVRSDVKGITGTNRGYTKIFFITNQFARDRDRADAEDELTKEFGVPVIILDRTWITKSVLENDRTDIAVEFLKIESLSSLIEKKVGPADFERQEELTDLERTIADPDAYGGTRYQLFEDCLRAAIVARGLGRPASEVNGLFIRAQKIAEESQNDKQRLRVAYDYAWTAIFWFDDYFQLNAMYDMVAGLAFKFSQAEDVELPANLLNVLSSQVHRGVLTAEQANLRERRAPLLEKLDELSADVGRPNNALQAKTTRAVLDVQAAVESGSPDKVEAGWRQFLAIAKAAEPLGD